MQNDRDRLIELADEKIETMRFLNSDHWFDFIEKMTEIIDFLLANGVILPPCKVGEKIWVIDREDGEAVDISCVMFLAKSKGCIIATPWINDYDLDETLEFHINETQNNFDTDLKVYPDEDCFLTREEAEKALERGKGNA